MVKVRFGNRYFIKYVLAALCLGILVGLTGCAPELLTWQFDEEVSLSENRGKRVLSLEELEPIESGTEEEEPDVSGNVVVEDDESTPDEAPEEDNFLYEGGSLYAYGQLSDSERLWYLDMAHAMGTMSDKIKLSEKGIEAGLDEDAVDKIFQAVLNDHPELFFVEGYSYTKYTRAEKTVAIEFSGTYSLDLDTALERRLEIEKAMEEFLAAVPDAEDEYEKIKFVYEKLIWETGYNVDAEENQNIYSVFVGHSSVCQGYSKAFQYLMNRLGIECTLVQGKVLETGEGHAWNLVKSNGEYYYVDTTWGDISYQDAAQNLPHISYDYLCVTTAQMERTHALGGMMSMPECTAVADNYYVREDALFARYDEEQMESLVNRKLEQGEHLIALRCESEECYEEMRDVLLDQREFFVYLAGTGISSFSYTSDDRQLTLTFFYGDK